MKYRFGEVFGLHQELAHFSLPRIALNCSIAQRNGAVRHQDLLFNMTITMASACCLRLSMKSSNIFGGYLNAKHRSPMARPRNKCRCILIISRKQVVASADLSIWLGFIESSCISSNLSVRKRPPPKQTNLKLSYSHAEPE